MTEHREDLAAKLRELHVRTGKSLKELEPLVHASDSSLSRYLSGRTVPPWPVVRRLSQIAGSPEGPARLLWERAARDRRHRAASADGEADPEPPAPTGIFPRRPRLALAAIVVATAVLAAGAGFWLGRETVTPPASTARPARLDAACADWDWPPAEGQAAQPPAKPASVDHAPEVQLMTGTLNGRQSTWAQLARAAYGDRVWLDWSEDGGATWTQCGPFLATSVSAVTRAHPLAKGVLHRACADTPRALHGLPRNACTGFW